MNFNKTISKLKGIILRKEVKENINNILSSLPPAPKGKVNIISGVGDRAKIETISKNKLVSLNGLDEEITNEMGNIYLYMNRDTAYVYFENFNRMILLSSYLNGANDEEKKKDAEIKLNNGFRNGAKNIVINNLTNISGIRIDDNNYPTITKEDIKTIINLTTGFPDPQSSFIYVFNNKVYISDNFENTKCYASDTKIDIDFNFSINVTEFRKIAKSPIIKIDKENSNLLDVNNKSVDITLLDELPDMINKLQNFTPNYKLNLNSSERNMLQTINKVVDKKNPKLELNAMLFHGDEHNVNVVATDTKRLILGKIQGNIPTDKEFIVPMKWITDKRIKEILFNDKYTKIISDKFIYFIRLIDGKFPNYKRIFPNSFNYEINLSSIQKEFIKKLKEVIKSKFNTLEMQFSDKQLSIKGYYSDNEEDNITATFKLDNKNFDKLIGINPKYLLDSLENCEEPILQINEPNLPIQVLCKKSGLKTIIAPLNM